MVEQNEASEFAELGARSAVSIRSLRLHWNGENRDPGQLLLEWRRSFEETIGGDGSRI
jgi:hypothetical protein